MCLFPVEYTDSSCKHHVQYLEYFIELWLIDVLYYISIILKAGVEQLRWLWGAVAQWSEHLWLKKETRVRFPVAAFLLQLAS